VFSASFLRRLKYSGGGTIQPASVLNRLKTIAATFRMESFFQKLIYVGLYSGSRSLGSSGRRRIGSNMDTERGPRLEEQGSAFSELF